LITGAHERSDHDPVDVGFCRKRFEIRRLAGEASGGGAGADDERTDPGQRCRDRVSETEGQEVRFRIGTQDAKGQHD
jgi:hypothetical protein